MLYISGEPIRQRSRKQHKDPDEQKKKRKRSDIGQLIESESVVIVAQEKGLISAIGTVLGKSMSLSSTENISKITIDKFLYSF